jgi:hypothetical protein
VITPEEVAERLTNLVTEIRETLDNESADRQQMLESVDTLLTRLADELNTVTATELVFDLILPVVRLTGTDRLFANAQYGKVCPSCGSPDPAAKPAVDDGERVTFVCDDAWHKVA